jgi:hypothetical protein
MCDVHCYDPGCAIDSDSDGEIWQVDQVREELHWALFEVWGKSLPGAQTLDAWQTAHLKYTDVFDTRTLFREFGVRGSGPLYVNTDNWRLLAESAHQYADMNGMTLENATCCMAQWFLN